jgi:putative exporter of polyketide antibiotics
MITFTRPAVQQIRRGLLIMLILVPGLSAIVVVQYRYTFADPAEAISLQVLAENPAIRVLFGVPLAGALNVVPIAALCLGAAQLAIGWLPQAVLALGATPAVGGFLLTVLVDTFDWPNWLGQLSPFAHLASVPAIAPNWAGAAGLISVSLLLAGLGIAGFARRDLRG